MIIPDEEVGGDEDLPMRGRELECRETALDFNGLGGPWIFPALDVCSKWKESHESGDLLSLHHLRQSAPTPQQNEVAGCTFCVKKKAPNEKRSEERGRLPQQPKRCRG